jgi:N-methylhydantoinase A
VHVSLSSEVLPRIREWPRLSTTLLNAYLEPVMVHYIDHLNAGSRQPARHAAALS